MPHIYLYICASLWLAGAYAKCPSLISDFSQETCISKSVSAQNDSFYYELEESSCIPKCKSYNETIYKNCASDQKCMPGYTCEQHCNNPKGSTCSSDSDCNSQETCDFYCVAETTESCMAYHINTEDYRDSYWSAQIFKPSCNNDYTWKAKQCKGGINGKCICYDSQGSRLFGEALFANAANMTCACSRHQADMGTTRVATFHCDSMGNYEPLQCDKLSEQCWCAEPQTGELLSPVVPEKAVHLLPCYSVDSYGSQYLRQCESKKFAQVLIKNKLIAHGVTRITEDFLLCDGDGSYGAFTIEQTNAYCTWRNNSKIGSWMSNIQSGYSDLNCNCARDYYMYGHSQTCLSTGNYKPLQTFSTNWYCVDSDGFSKTGILTDLGSNAQDSECDKYF